MTTMLVLLLPLLLLVVCYCFYYHSKSGNRARFSANSATQAARRGDEIEIRVGDKMKNARTLRAINFSLGPKQGEWEK